MHRSSRHDMPDGRFVPVPVSRPWTCAMGLWIAFLFGVPSPSFPVPPDLPLGGDNETTIAVDPNDPTHIACASLQELRVSTDGGATFQTAVRAPIPEGTYWAADPSLAFDAQGRLFWAYLASVGPYLTSQGLYLAQCDPSTGEVLAGYPVNVTLSTGTPPEPDKEWLAIDSSPGSPFLNRIYLAWLQALESGNNHVRSTYSTDQGMTWSAPLLHGTDPSLGSTFGVHNAVAPNGDVYLAFHSQPVRNPTNGISGQVFVSRSNDGGASYQPPTLAFPPGTADISWNYQNQAGPIQGARFLTLGSVQPWVLPDPVTAGRVYVVACDDPDNQHGVGDDANVYMVTSIDHGATWSVPARVDSGHGTQVPYPIANPFQLFPTAAIDPESGVIAVHYYDNRNGAVNPDGNYLLDVFATHSTDGGVTFSPDVQINDVPFDPDAGAYCREPACGPILTRIWGSSASDVFAVGFGGHIVHYDGQEWSIQWASGPDLWGVWGNGPDEVFVVGDAGVIRHFDGNSWTLQPSGTSQLLWSVWGTAANDVFAVGAGGTILHYDGNSWSPQPSGTTAELTAIWGSASDDVHVVGAGGTILHYDGGAWSDQSSPASELLGDIWGSAPDDVFVVGYEGGIFHYDGLSWSLHDDHPGRILAGVWGSGAADVFASDYRGGMLHFDGNSWSEMSPIYLCWGVWGSSGTDVYSVSNFGRIYHYDGAAWAEQDNPLVLTDSTLRIGEYNGIAVAGDWVHAVWCGNDDNALGDPIAQQVIYNQRPTTGIDLTSGVIPEFRKPLLRQNRPNPFRGRTSIGVDLPAEGSASLRVYDADGRFVRTLVGRRLGPGLHRVDWDGRDDRGREVPSGIYWYQLRTEDRRETRRLVVVR